MRRISGRNHSLRSGLSQRQMSSAIAVLARALHLHFSSLRHGDYRSREDKPKSLDRRWNRWFGVNVPHAPRPAEWAAILFLCLPTLTRPGLDLGLSRTGNGPRFIPAHEHLVDVPSVRRCVPKNVTGVLLGACTRVVRCLWKDKTGAVL